MIKSFKNRALKALYETGAAKGIDSQSLAKIQRLLSALDAATCPEDMDLPGFKFHPLKGDRKGTYDVTIRANFRLTFKWEGGAVQVDSEDYHGR